MLGGRRLGSSAEQQDKKILIWAGQPQVLPIDGANLKMTVTHNQNTG
jgi:hypothetical protein